MIFEKKDFQGKVAEIDAEIYRDAYVFVYCSVDAIIPIWASRKSSNLPEWQKISFEPKRFRSGFNARSYRTL